MTKIQEGQIYRNIDTGNTWRVTDASRPLIRLVHVETEDRAQVSRGAIARFYILQSPADPVAATAQANLRAQVAAEVEHAKKLQPTPTFSEGRDGYFLRDGKHIGSTRDTALTRRIVDLLNQHGEG
jgi:hypothetical protein